MGIVVRVLAVPSGHQELSYIPGTMLRRLQRGYKEK